MKITEDVRNYAAQEGLSEEAALEVGMAAKGSEFREGPGEIYQSTEPTPEAEEAQPAT